ncbi:MAG TPA: M56 family metallopeptidase [Sphingomicrobium sp.]|nr:M56 family metallopeptidase [Sphingomicrobium sp.]
MDWLIPLAAKSFVFAGGALLLLRLLRNRSAADRSWIAHLALAGLLLLPLAAVALPSLDVAGPEFLVGTAEVQSPSSAVLPRIEPTAAPAAQSAPVSDDPGVGGASVDWPFWGYVVPAGLLVLLTLIALVRLFVLKARATVLVDAPWLTALAHAQRRMGFKHGTALLTSDELPSPISWGVVRPVILLNTEASQSHAEAEAIITHELAHVANLDWAKLLIARVATALFWFNPFVWLLAREAHQLREEAADDAVLATDIDETEYAKLLVGVARHECRGLLIGAHGVAPARNSLARRVKRVLDGAVKRAPGGWRWGSAAAFFAAGMAVPVAALNLVPATAATTNGSDIQNPYYAGTTQPGASAEASTPSEIQVADGVATLKSGKTTIRTADGRTILSSSDGGTITTKSDGTVVMVGPTGGKVQIYPPDSNGRRRAVAIGPSGSRVEFADARAVPGLAVAISSNTGSGHQAKSAVDRAIELKAVGVTPEYIASIRSAAPQLRLDHDDIVSLKAVGVTASFIQELARLGYRNLDADDITGAYAVGVREDYVRSLAAAGYGRLSMDELTQLKAVGVTAKDIERFRAAGFSHIDVDKLTELKTLGITPEELKASEDYGP